MLIAQDQYDALVARRAALDGMMWQTPALSLTAQAFLFTISLGSGIAPGARLMSAFLALAAALASIQLMAKHRYHEVRDSRLLEEFERDSGNNYVVIHGRPSDTDKEWYHFSSYNVWIAMLAVFALAAVAVIAGVIFSLEWIVGSP